MQSLSDDERRQVLGDVLSDQLQAILEYVQEIPSIKRKLYEVDERLIEVERIVKVHELDIRQIRQYLAV
jgi:hypothetical protein